MQGILFQCQNCFTSGNLEIWHEFQHAQIVLSAEKEVNI